MAKEMEVVVPDIGDYESVPVIDVLVKTGDVVEKEAPLVTLESDKATMDVPAPAAGTIKTIRLKVGDKVKQGSAVLVLETGDSEAEPESKDAKPEPKPDANTAQASNKEAKAQPAKEKPAATKNEAVRPAAADSKKAAPKTGGQQEVTVPDIGDYHDVPVIDVLVKEGDVVAKDDTLLTLESDKATLDVPAPAAGTVRAMKLKTGDKVSKGAAICTLEIAAAEGDQASAEPSAAAKSADKSADKTPGKTVAPGNQKPDVEAAPSAGNLGQAPLPPPASRLPSAEEQATSAEIPHASPSIRKFARELGVDLARLKGSAPHARITREDVQGYVKQALAAPAASGSSGIPKIPAIDFAQFGAVETKPLARIRKLSAAHVHRSWLNIPHVTQFDEADITELEAFRKSQSEETGVKLTLLPFVMKAVANALAAYPDFNSSLSPDGESLIFKRYVHIGFAADTPNGLVVPVVRDVDRKGLVALAQETAELAKKARDGKLKGDEMKGGCFSISSLGGIGGSHFTPIVNAPEVGILGVSRSSIKPLWDGKTFQPRLLVPLSLSYDHRVIDGAYAARFIVQLVKLLSDLRKLSL